LPVRVLTGASLSFRLSPRNTCPSCGFCIKFVLSVEHLSARSVALWQATSPLISFAASEAG
jgi:hypothetical protein